MARDNENEGLIRKGADLGEALSDFLTALAGRPAREVEQILLGMGAKLRGPESPIPEPLRSVVGPVLEGVARAAALAPDAIADAAEGANRVLGGDQGGT